MLLSTLKRNNSSGSNLVKKRPVIAKKMQTIFSHAAKSPSTMQDPLIGNQRLERSPSQGSKIQKQAANNNNSLFGNLLSKFFQSNQN
jgi:hypothetical protein